MRKKNIIGLFIILIIVVTLAIVINFYKNHEVKNSYKKIIVDDKILIDRYFSQISTALENQDFSTILSIMDLSDNKYAAMGSADIKRVLESNGLLGEKLELIGYKKYSNTGEKNVYEIRIKSLSSKNEKKLIITETYPDSYRVLFDF